MLTVNLLDVVALVWFILVWAGYGYYTEHKSNSIPTLSSTLDIYRGDWMRRVLMRENRIADASVLGNLERNGAFFASSSLLIMAGILTALGYADEAMVVFQGLPWTTSEGRLMWELKLATLLVVFIYSFFKFTWSMRQYNFCSVLVGSAPLNSEKGVSPAERRAFASSAAEVANLAGDTFNLGLRSYYYGLAVLAWFIHPIAFMVASTAVVAILYQREFHSKALSVLRSGKTFEDVN